MPTASSGSKSTSNLAAKKRAKCCRSTSANLAQQDISSARTSLPMCQPNSRLAQEEIFGPVLAVIRAARFDRSDPHRQRHRLRTDRRHLFAQPGESGSRRREFQVGNLYLNRPITGALLGGNRSADSNSLESAAKPADPIIYCSSLFRAPLQKTRCGVGSRHRQQSMASEGSKSEISHFKSEISNSAFVTRKTSSRSSPFPTASASASSVRPAVPAASAFPEFSPRRRCRPKTRGPL